MSYPSSVVFCAGWLKIAKGCPPAKVVQGNNSQSYSPPSRVFANGIAAQVLVGELAPSAFFALGEPLSAPHLCARILLVRGFVLPRHGRTTIFAFAFVVHNHKSILKVAASYSPLRVFVRVVPCVSGEAVAHLVVRRAAATAARRILAHSSHLLMGGLLRLGLVAQLRFYIWGDGLLAGDPDHVM